MWQDFIFAVGSMVFAASLLPVLLGKGSGLSRWTSVASAGFLYLYAITFGTLGLWWSAGTAGVNAVAWTLVAIFRGPRV